MLISSFRIRITTRIAQGYHNTEVLMEEITGSPAFVVHRTCRQPCAQLQGAILYEAAPSLSKDPVYAHVYMLWLDLLILHLVPFFGLAAANSAIVAAVRRASR